MVTLIPDGDEEGKMTQILYVNKEPGRKIYKQTWIMDSFNQQWPCEVTAFCE